MKFHHLLQYLNKPEILFGNSDVNRGNRGIRMKTEQQYYEEAISMKAYMDNMSKLKEESFAIYESFEIPQDDFIEQLTILIFLK